MIKSGASGYYWVLGKMFEVHVQNKTVEVLAHIQVNHRDFHTYSTEL